MHTISEKPLTPTSSTHQETEALAVHASTQEAPYCFFKANTSYADIDAALWAPWSTANEHSDADNLRRFCQLKALAAQNHQDQFTLDLESDAANNSWRYTFSMGNEQLYASEARIIGHGMDLQDYESHYVGGILPAISDLARIKTDLSAIRHGSDNEAAVTIDEHLDRLATFQALEAKASPTKTNLFRKVVDIDSQNHTWTYQFSIGQVLIVKSAPINIGFDGNTSLSQFRHAVMTQNFRQTMNAKDGFQWVAIRDSGMLMRFKDNRLEMDANLARNFERLAAFAYEEREHASIELEHSTFRFLLKGAVVLDGQIPPSPENRGLTQRVHIAMSALRVALAPLNDTYQAIRANLNVQETASLRRAGQTSEDGSPLTLRQAIDNNGIGLAGIYSLEHPNGNAAFSVNVVSDQGVERTFTIRRGTPTILESDLDMKLLKSLCVPMRLDIYDQAVSSMNENERTAFHTQMHHTSFGEFTLGDILDIPEPIINGVSQVVGIQYF